jgi:hypothetical protein
MSYQTLARASFRQVDLVPWMGGVTPRRRDSHEVWGQYLYGWGMGG